MGIAKNRETAIPPGEWSFRVEGMHCASCVNRIESALRRELTGLTEARVSFADGRVILQGAVSPSEACAVIEGLGYRATPESESAGQTDQSGDAKRRADKLRLGIAVALTVPLAALHMANLSFAGSDVLQAILATVVLFACGGEIFRSAFAGVMQHSLGMDVLIALGSGTAWIYSLLRLLSPAVSRQAGGHHLYFETAAMMITLVLLGRYLEKRARNRAADAVEALARLQPDTILLQRLSPSEGQMFEAVPLREARVGDIALVRPGMGIPLDGVVLEGESPVYESMMTGESRPIPKRPGDALIGGTLNGSGGLTFRISRVGEETTLARMIALVRRAMSDKPPIQKLADRVAAVFTPLVLVISGVTLAGWLLTGHAAAQGLSAAIATLVVACPCALGLATPVAVQVGLGRLAREGILIRNADALELTHRLNILVLDKTGTLTQGRPDVTAFDRFVPIPASELEFAFTERDCIRWATALEIRSEHPLADAIVRYAADRMPGQPLPDVRDFFNRPGAGVGGQVEGHAVLLGAASFLSANGVEVSENSTRSASDASESRVFLAVDGWLAGIFRIADPIRPNAGEALQKLRRMGIQPFMLSGDHPEVARAVGEALGFSPEEIRAGVSPEEKQAFIQSLQNAPKGPDGKSDGKRRPIVAMAGDGVNDAPALARADIGIAMGSGTDIAMRSAHMTLLHGDITRITVAIETSRAIVRTIRQNLFWAFFYNLLALPVAALGGLNPMIAAAAMSLSSLMVVLNSLRLRGR